MLNQHRPCRGLESGLDVIHRMGRWLPEKVHLRVGASPKHCSGSGKEDTVMPSLEGPRTSSCLVVGTALLLVPICVPYPIAAQEADFSAISEIQDLAPLLAPHVFLVPAPPGTVQHEIPILERCPAQDGANGTQPNNGDGDGDGDADDRQLDLNGVKPGLASGDPNGSLELWCIDPVIDGSSGVLVYGGFYSLVYDPAGPMAGPRFIGKCPFAGGTNWGRKFLNPRTAHIQQIQWQSRDRGADDDGDGKLDEWLYKYDVAADTVEQEHIENATSQADGAAPAAPQQRPFTFPDLLPRNPAVDDPTAGLATGAGGMRMDLPRILAGEVATLELRTVIANDGPMASAESAVTVTVEAPDGCAVDSTGVSKRNHVRTVEATNLDEVFDQFGLSCQSSGVYVFTIATEVVPHLAGISDPLSEDDMTSATLTVEVVSILEVPTLSTTASVVLALFLLASAGLVLRHKRAVKGSAGQPG
jgi:hypothetical protein